MNEKKIETLFLRYRIPIDIRCSMKSSLTYPLPIRLDKHTRDRVAIAAERLGTPKSTIIRMGILQMIGQIESGIISVPQRRPIS